MKVIARGCLAGVLVLGLSGASQAQESKSSSLVTQLTAALDAGKLDSVAAKDPSKPDVFIAALYFPGSQLLVVSAKYAQPDLLVGRLGKKEYRDMYLDLQSASAGSKVFVRDTGADGLKPKTYDSVDIDAGTVSFDGDWRKQKIASEDDYQKALADADERYNQLLTVLLARLKTP
jgi:hypothetical protein